jgi:hypothetical protein
MLDGPLSAVGDISCRVISAEAQLWTKEEVPKALGHAKREYDAADVALLRDVLTASSASTPIRPFVTGAEET